MMKRIRKYRVIIIVVIIIAILVCAYFAFNTFLYPSDSKSIYGDRLNGIEDVQINKDRQNSLINEIKKNSEVKSASMNIQGIIINIIITGNDTLTIDKGKEIAGNCLTKFSDKEQKFYDIQVFVTNSKLNMIGYKEKKAADLVWTVSEVDENETQAE